MSYTKEQLKYINYDGNITNKKCTKLLACAGSGKTRCIIARISGLIKKKIYKIDEILMLTFSRFTRDDFINKVKDYGDDTLLSSKCNFVKTIDSFAKQIIDPDAIIDVSLLSFKLMNFLDIESKETLCKIDLLKKIKIIFIDEAQDLNEIQYKIFCHMRDKLNIVVNMIGDPNQNIYQFRDSSDKYLTQFDGIVFKLTRNFRSYEAIVNFSKYLRPFTENDIICTKGINDCMPIMIFYEDEKILETNIIDLLNSAQKHDVDLSEFAILSPTRGRMNGGGKSHGLCFISNILYKAKIKFKQFYEEASNNSNTTNDSNEGSIEGGIKYCPTKGHVNILTYMGSKGLEWNYVIIIDADACLINKKYFNEEKHNHDQYLLYVACSRAIQNMYIFSRCNLRNDGMHYNINPWFKKIPSHYYQIDNRFSKDFTYPQLRYVQFQTKDTYLSRLIDKKNCYELDKLSNLINFQSRKIKSRTKIFKQDYSSIEKPAAIFLTRYTENLFRALYNIKMNRKQIAYPEIENIIESDNIVMGLSEEVSQWYFHNRKFMTWLKFDNDANILKPIKDSINKVFDRNKEFNSHIIAPNGYYQLFILNQKTWIKTLYQKYIHCKNTSQIRELLFYLMVIMHGINTQHYYHIKSKGKKYNHILIDFKELFDELEEYVDDMNYNFTTINEIVQRWDIISKIDLIDENDELWNIRCSSEISLKHTLQSIISTLMYNTHLIDDDFKLNISNFVNSTIDSDSNPNSESIMIDINYLNFIKGEEISYTFNLSPYIIKKIVDILLVNNDNDINDKTNMMLI